MKRREIKEKRKDDKPSKAGKIQRREECGERINGREEMRRERM